jgi:zinc D-Ala-D-Ala dipeptidase
MEPETPCSTVSPPGPVLISDPRVVAIPVIECGEPLVDLRYRGFRVVDLHPRVSSRERTRFSCRFGVLSRLLAADAELPSGLHLAIAEAHRPLHLQRESWEGDLAMFRDRHPDWDQEELERETSRLSAPPWGVPPHSTGGAVDVVVVDASGDEVDMGSPLNGEGPLMRTDAPGLAPHARANRDALVSAMTSAGLVNYGTEWWHWSYGDRYWAFISGAPAAIYGTVDR